MKHGYLSRTENAMDTPPRISVYQFRVNACQIDIHLPQRVIDIRWKLNFSAERAR
jgi:hypothetical protein